MDVAAKNIIHKLENLPQNLLGEVENFIDFLQAKHAKKKYPEFKEELSLVKEPKSLYGAARGIIAYIADDFNEPLDEFKDYMSCASY